MASRRRGWRHEAAWIVGVQAFVAACAAAQAPDPGTAQSPGPGMSGALPGAPLPAGAIPAGDNIYMVPLGADETGCMQYRMHAPGRATVQAIFYADGKGGFTMNREAAACPPTGAGGPR